MELESAINAPSSWPRMQIDEICKRFTSGGTPSRRIPHYYQSGTIPWVKTKELGDSYISDTEVYITEDASANSSAKVLPAETVLMAMYGATVGKLGRLSVPMACNQACAAMIVDSNKANANYLFYQLLSHREEIVSYATGAAQQNLSGVQIKNFVLPFPSLDEQEAIGALLATLDDKIELNRQTNETLEALARALFKDWFVDFGPTRTKAEGGAPYLAPELWALFPDALDDEDKPVGWNWELLGDHLEVLETGKRPKGGVANILEGVPSVGAESIEHVGRFDYGKTKYVGRDFFFKMNKGICKCGDVLIYKDGGKPGELRPAVTYVSEDFPFSEFCINEHVFRARTSSFSQQFLYCTLKTDNSFWQMREKATGVAQPGLNQAAVNSIEIMLPHDEKLLRSCESFIDPIINACNQNSNESRTLAQTRDLLLPKLMSGEIRLRDAEKTVEAVL